MPFLLNIADLIWRKTLLFTTLCKYLGTFIHSSSSHEKSMVQKSIAISSVELLLWLPPHWKFQYLPERLYCVGSRFSKHFNCMDQWGAAECMMYCSTKLMYKWGIIQGTKETDCVNTLSLEFHWNVERTNQDIGIVTVEWFGYEPLVFYFGIGEWFSYEFNLLYFAL